MSKMPKIGLRKNTLLYWEGSYGDLINISDEIDRVYGRTKHEHWWMFVDKMFREGTLAGIKEACLWSIRG